MPDTTPQAADPQRPRIALRQGDQQALLAIAHSSLLRDARSAGALLDEVARADLLADDETSVTVGLWSRVHFLDGQANSARWITLVPPQQARTSTEHVSVLTPLGAALIGLSKGQRIQCPDRHGGELNLTVLDVVHADQNPGDQP